MPALEWVKAVYVCVWVCVHILLWKWQKCWWILIQWLILTTPGEMAAAAIAADLAEEGTTGDKVNSLALINTHIDAHTQFSSAESVITLIQGLFFMALPFYLVQAGCLCIVTWGAKHTPVLFPYSVGVTHQNISIIKMLTICGLCSTRIYSKFKSPHPPGEQNKECY